MKLHHAVVLCIAATLAGHASMTRAAGVFRCQNGTYQDHPCAEGQRPMAIAKQAASGASAKACSELAAYAERTSTSRTKGVKLRDALKEIELSNDSPTLKSQHQTVVSQV